MLFFNKEFYDIFLCFINKQNSNLVPLPTSDLTEILPPIYSIIFLTIINPSPVPLSFISFLSFSFPKYLNNFLRSLSLIPIPESSTSKYRSF
jgi:hypothetical protein